MKKWILAFCLMIGCCPSLLSQVGIGPSHTGALAVATITPYIRSVRVCNNSSATTLACAMPTGTVAGDIVQGYFGGANSDNIITSGWTRYNGVAQSYWNGDSFFKAVTSGDISGGISLNTGGSNGPMILILVDLIGATGCCTAYNKSAGTTNPASTAINQSSSYNGNLILYMATYNASGAIPTITTQYGAAALLASFNSAGTMAVYWQMAPNHSSQSVTAYFPGTYSNGYYAGWVALLP